VVAPPGPARSRVAGGHVVAPPGPAGLQSPPVSHVPRVIGVDVGGTKISVATLRDGVLDEPCLQQTDVSSTDALVEQLIAAIADAGPADAVGLGVPSVVEFATGMARHSVNIPLEGVPLRRLLGERLGMPAYIDNDASVAALAEAYDDDLRPLAGVLVMITVGTGVGGGIVLNGRVFRGATGAAPELGHIIVGADLTRGAPPAAARAPQPGSLEALASGRALDVLGRERGFADGTTVVRAGQAGDPAALDALRIHSERLGIGIANVVNLFDPDVVVIGGGVSTAGELLLEPARSTARRFILPGVGTKTEIRLARYGPEAGVRGAALMALLEGR
jgi:glucokinase